MILSNVKFFEKNPNRSVFARIFLLRRRDAKGSALTTKLLQAQKGRAQD
jgi:hypothetical protein